MQDKYYAEQKLQKEYREKDAISILSQHVSGAGPTDRSSCLTKMAIPEKEIPPEEVLLHNSPTDAWAILDGVVYDITYFLPLHPGGDGIILPLLGQDMTEEFDDIGHSAEARRLLIPMAVGKAKTSGSKHSPRSLSESRSANSDFAPSPGSPEALRHRIGKSSLDKPDFCQSVVDLQKPLILQVYRLTLEEYVNFSREKIYSEESYRMFSSNILEALSRTKWFIVPLVWLPVSVFCMYYGILSTSNPWSLPLFWITGVFLWTFFEYVFHRFLFHYSEESLPDHPIAFVVHFAAHAIHHVFPMDRLRLVMPPVLFSILAFPVFIFSKYIICLPGPVLCPLWSGRFFEQLSLSQIVIPF